MSVKKVAALVLSVLCLFSAGSSVWAQAKELSYENSAMGVKITGPTGWYLTPGEKAQQAAAQNISNITNVESMKEATKKLGFLVVFSEYPYGSPREYNPNISLITEPISQEYASVLKTPLDVANSNILGVKAAFKDVKVLKGPVSVNINGREGAQFVYEGTIVMGYLQIMIKSSVICFLKENLSYTLSFTDKADNFNSNVRAFESTVKTFILK